MTITGAAKRALVAVAMDRNRVLLIGGALVLMFFLAYPFAPGGVLPR